VEGRRRESDALRAESGHVHSHDLRPWLRARVVDVLCGVGRASSLRCGDLASIQTAHLTLSLLASIRVSQFAMFNIDSLRQAVSASRKAKTILAEEA
jgi:hypothetical protein